MNDKPKPGSEYAPLVSLASAVCSLIAAGGSLTAGRWFPLWAFGGVFLGGLAMRLGSRWGQVLVIIGFCSLPIGAVLWAAGHSL